MGQPIFSRSVCPARRENSLAALAPTLGIIGRLGGVGARPAAIGLVSDGDGAVTALAVALKLVDMARRGDQTSG